MIILGFAPGAWVQRVRDRGFASRLRRLSAELVVLRFRLELARTDVSELIEATS